VEVPKNVSISCPAMKLSVHYALKENKLVATRELTFLKDNVMPEEYPAFKNFVNELTEAENKQLALK
jgi:hypothetical protein